MTLAELKAKATELGLTPDDVRAYGSLAKKATWETAIAEFKQPETEDSTHQNAIAQSEKPDNNAVQRNTDEELPFEPTHTLIDGEWVESADIVDPSQLPTLKETDERFKDWEPWMIPSAVFSNALGLYSILYFDKWGNCHCKELDTEREWWACYRISSLTGLSNSSTPIESSAIVPFHPVPTQPVNWVKETSESSTPIRDKLLAKMMGYVGTALSLSDLEEMQKESPDEVTAAIYLGILEDSERLLKQAVAA